MLEPIFKIRKLSKRIWVFGTVYLRCIKEPFNADCCNRIRQVKYTSSFHQRHKYLEGSPLSNSETVIQCVRNGGVDNRVSNVNWCSGYRCSPGKAIVDEIDTRRYVRITTKCSNDAGCGYVYNARICDKICASQWISVILMIVEDIEWDDHSVGAVFQAIVRTYWFLQINSDVSDVAAPICRVLHWFPGTSGHTDVSALEGNVEMGGKVCVQGNIICSDVTLVLEC